MSEELEEVWEEYSIPCIECEDRLVKVTIPLGDLNEDDPDDIEV